MALQMGNWGYNPYKWSHNPTYNWYGKLPSGKLPNLTIK